MILFRAFIIFVACVIVGTVGFPFVLWALSGFPDGDSHGLWMPITVGIGKGAGGGFVIGVFAALISLCHQTREDSSESENQKKDE